MTLRASLAMHGGWDELLEVLRSSGASQEWIWSLEGGSGIFGCSSVELRLLWGFVALWAKGTPPAASWRFQECGGEVRLEWCGLWSEVEALEVSDQNGCASVYGEMWRLLGVSG